MQHDISLAVINTSSGTPPQSDGVMMIFSLAVAVGGTFALDTAYLLTSLADANALGINAAYDVTNSTSLFQQIQEFYLRAGTGALLWVVGVPTNTTYAAFVAGATFDALIKYTGQADPANRAKIVGLCYMPPTLLETATDFPADVTAAITAAQTKQQQLFLAGYPFSVIIDGYNMSSAVTPATIGTQATNTAFAVSLCITGSKPNGIASVGLALGKFARISIGHGLGDVGDGGEPITAAYLTNSVLTTPASLLVVGHVYTVLGGTVTYNAVVYPTGAQITAVIGHTGYITADTGYLVDNITPIGNIPGTTIQGLTDAYIDLLGAKQFMFLRTWQNTAGYYWNDAATCVSSATFISSQEYNRVINSLSAAVRTFFTQFINHNLPLDKTTGNVAQGWLNNQQELYYDQYIGPLNDSGGTGDITDGSLVVTGVNFNATRILSFALTIVPSTLLGGVAGTVQFTAKL